MFSAGDPVVKQLYFFTKLRTYDNGTCFDRRVGSGSWSKDKFCKTSLKGIEKIDFATKTTRTRHLNKMVTGFCMSTKT